MLILAKRLNAVPAVVQAHVRNVLRFHEMEVKAVQSSVGQSIIGGGRHRAVSSVTDVSAAMRSTTPNTMETQALVSGESSGPAGTHNPVRGFLEIATSDPIMANRVR